MKEEIYDSFYYDGRKKKWKKENFNDGLPPRPSVKCVNTWCKRWEETTGYLEREHALEKLFQTLLTNNQNLDDVLIKVCTLNDFYSTNIYNVLPVANEIVSMRLDDILESDQVKPSAVDTLNEMVYRATNKHIYSFATKYFSHHRPDIYPIYDSYVDKLLRYYRDEYSFFEFDDKKLLTYEGFYEVHNKFREFFNLTQFTVKEADKFLWQVGKHHFPRYEDK